MDLLKEQRERFRRWDAEDAATRCRWAEEDAATQRQWREEDRKRAIRHRWHYVLVAIVVVPLGCGLGQLLVWLIGW